jgi:hypothetical protein
VMIIKRLAAILLMIDHAVFGGFDDLADCDHGQCEARVPASPGPAIGCGTDRRPSAADLLYKPRRGLVGHQRPRL